MSFVYALRCVLSFGFALLLPLLLSLLFAACVISTRVSNAAAVVVYAVEVGVVAESRT